MNTNIPPPKTPYRWRVELTGHIDELHDAVEAIEKNLEEAWIGVLQKSDADQTKAIITLKWLDKGMTQMVRTIIETDHEAIKIIFNGGVDENGDRIKT